MVVLTLRKRHSKEAQAIAGLITDLIDALEAKEEGNDGDSGIR